MPLFVRIYNFLIRIVCGFVPDKVLRKNLRAKYTLYRKNCTNSPYTKNKAYGKIYYPIYSKSSAMKAEPTIYYSSSGKPLIPFFYRGSAGCMLHTVMEGEYFFGDRFDISLDNHLYLDMQMIETIGNPKKKYGMFSEPETISPDAYEMAKQNKNLNKDFDLIFTHSQKILDMWDNARPFCYFATVWHRLCDENGNLPEDWYEKKTKDISIVSSDKIMCNLHKYRLELAKKCKREHLADTYGTFDGGLLVKPQEYLDNYRYSIIVENDLDSYWFTEKVLNCFATMTIPVYIGATKIGEIFNEDGIIRITEKDFDNIDKILKQCTKEEYEARIDILKENYEKSKQFCSSKWDRLYTKYLKEDLEK